MSRTLAFALCAALAAPAVAGPNPQLTHLVAQRLDRIGIHVVPETLTTAQAAGLHMMLVSTRGYSNQRRKALVMLRRPDFRD